VGGGKSKELAGDCKGSDCILLINSGRIPIVNGLTMT